MKRAAAQVATATLVLAVAGYAAQLIGARALGPADYSVFAVFWAALFIVIGFMNGIVQDTTRVARIAKLRLDAGEAQDVDKSHPRAVLVAVIVGIGFAILVLATGIGWGPVVFGASWLGPCLLIALGPLLVAIPVAASGVLAGMARWGGYSTLIVLEGIARLIAFVVVALLAPSVEWFMVATVAGFAASMLQPAFDRRTREQLASVRYDVPLRGSFARMLQAMLATGLSGILVNGLPVLISAAAAVNPRGASPAELGVLILLVILTRAPLTVPLSNFQSAFIARFTSLDARGRRRWLGVAVLLVLAASTVLAILAALVGPPLLPIVFGAGFEAGPWIVGALTAAASGLGIIALTSAAAIAASRHTLYLAGWAVAILVSLVLLFTLPIPLDWATASAVAAGPIAGAVVHLLGLRRSTTI